MICAVCEGEYLPSDRDPSSYAFMIPPEVAGDKQTRIGAAGGVAVGCYLPEMDREVRVLYVPGRICGLRCLRKWIKMSARAAEVFLEKVLEDSDEKGSGEEPDGDVGSATSVLERTEEGP